MWYDKMFEAAIILFSQGILSVYLVRETLSDWHKSFVLGVNGKMCGCIFSVSFLNNFEVKKQKIFQKGEDFYLKIKNPV